MGIQEIQGDLVSSLCGGDDSGDLLRLPHFDDSPLALRSLSIPPAWSLSSIIKAA
jgi:hypothetical protein